MSSVKGSAQYRMVVMPYRPMRRVFNYFFGFLLLLIVAAACFFYGYDQGLNQRISSGRGQPALVELQQITENLRQEVANLQLAAVVDAQAHEDVRRENLDQKSKIAELERDIAVYRGMVSNANNSNPQGISLGAFQVTGSGGVRGYHYKMVVQQLVVDKETFEGQLKVNIVGVRDGKPASIPLHKASLQVAGEFVALSFKYFQTIEGDLILPEGFEPQRVDVLVQATNKKKPTRVEHQIAWSAAS